MNERTPTSSNKLTRRDALRHLSAGALLAFGLWPGRLRAADNGQGESFRFIVINDTHYLTDQCGEYIRGVVAAMKKLAPDFCLHGGDLTDKGEPRHLEAVKDVFDGLGAPVYPVIGNHDYLTQTDRRAYEQTFSQRLNYHFGHRGWQFVGLDSSEGQRYEGTAIQPETVRWLDDSLPGLSRTAPTVVFTHFPLGLNVRYRPSNADAVLDRFRELNLVAVFSGHFHGFTERQAGRVALTTNRCCSLQRGNHDGTKEKGYFVCTAKEGRLTREFIEHQTPPTLPPKPAGQ